MGGGAGQFAEDTWNSGTPPLATGVNVRVTERNSIRRVPLVDTPDATVFTSRVPVFHPRWSKGGPTDRRDDVRGVARSGVGCGGRTRGLPVEPGRGKRPGH